MRKLTVKRTKTFVAFLATLNVYIEDAVAPDLTIGGVPCRKLGPIKNGEEVTFEIEDSSVRVYVIADKLSRNWCNDFYILPEGSEDVTLTGACKYSPTTGNAFRFDNNDTYEAFENRRQAKRKGTKILIISVIIGIVIGFLIGFISDFLDDSEPVPENFYAEEMTLTLTDEFIEVDVAQYTASYATEDVAVFVLREDFSLMADLSSYTLEGYMDLTIKANNFSPSDIEKLADPLGFAYEYTNPETNDTYRYFAYVYKSDEAFWLVQFATLAEDVDEYESIITEWASSVTFD